MLKQTILQNENKLKETKDNLSSEAEKNRHRPSKISQSPSTKNEVNCKRKSTHWATTKENSSMQKKKGATRKNHQRQRKHHRKLKRRKPKRKRLTQKKLQRPQRPKHDEKPRIHPRHHPAQTANRVPQQQNEETNKVIESNQKQYEQKLFALRSKVKKDFT